MTRLQHQKTRALAQAEGDWLEAYGWQQEGCAWRHRAAPKIRETYAQRDALILTRAEPLKYGGAQ